MICIFAGPTLAGGSPPPSPVHAVLLPPASQGDVYRVAAQHPWAIAIIDGYFDRVPAVTHKEILWAMSEGVHVFGAASMGALRAAELEAFGMEGAGRIFADYRDGVLEDDDEVAVSHAMEEDGFRPASEAMVNIRATLDAAVRAGVIGPSERTALVALGKSLFYPHRYYSAILERAGEYGIGQEHIAALRNWLPRGRVDQKRADAFELLTLLTERFQTRPKPKQVSYHFNQTEMWDFAMRQTPFLAGREGENEPLMDELRLLGTETYRRVWDGALLRALAKIDAARQELVASPGDVQRAARAAERRMGPDPAHGAYEEAAYSQCISSEARLNFVRQFRRFESAGQMRSELLFRGILEELAARADRKRGALERLGVYDPDLRSKGISWEELLAWYFQRSGQAVPENLDDYAAQLDLPGTDVLCRLMLREYIFALEQNHPGAT